MQALSNHFVHIANLYEDIERSLNALRQDPSRINQSRQWVEEALKDKQAYYGINTGFGALANQRISDEQIKILQKNLILSHAVGVSDPVPKAISRLMLQCKIHALGQGYSGISLKTFARLLDFEALDLIPVIPSRGSVGASGDLAPLAHLSLTLLGEGSFWSDDAQHFVAAKDALTKRQLHPISLEAKDGLALINGTQLMTAYAAYILENSIHLLKCIDCIAAMSLDALKGSIKPFDPRIQDIRPHPGQRIVARNIRRLLEDSEILHSHRECEKVQDPYTLRCIPQVHGASRDLLQYVVSVVETELNSVTDNPLVFDNGDIISGGNFHGQPLALALDSAALALAELANISERRIYLLLSGHDGLPRFLIENAGINSGFMVPQYTAAALVAENKVLAHPASVDSIPTCLGQEDHVSMGSISALKLLNIFNNLEQVVAIECITAAQALDYRRPLTSGTAIELAHRYIRDRIPHRDRDGLFQQDMDAALTITRGKQLQTHLSEHELRLD